MSDNLPSTMKANRRIADQICKVCKTSFRLGTDVRVCQSCGLILHDSCWTHSGGCSRCAASSPAPTNVPPTGPKPVFGPDAEVVGQAPRKIDPALQAVVAKKRAGRLEDHAAPPLPKHAEVKGRLAPPLPKPAELRCKCGELLIREMVTCPQCGRHLALDDSGSGIHILGAFLISFIPAVPVAFVSAFLALGLAAGRASNIHTPPAMKPNVGQAVATGFLAGFIITYVTVCSILLIRCFRRPS